MEKIRRLKFKEVAKKGEIIKIKTLAEHDMESGVRRDPDTGVIYPRFIIQKVTAKYNGKLVFRANWFSGVSPNPILTFYIKAEKSGLIEIEWKDDYSTSTYKRAYIKVLDENNEEVLPVDYTL